MDSTRRAASSPDSPRVPASSSPDSDSPRVPASSPLVRASSSSTAPAPADAHCPRSHRKRKRGGRSKSKGGGRVSGSTNAAPAPADTSILSWSVASASALRSASFLAEDGTFRAPDDVIGAIDHAYCLMIMKESDPMKRQIIATVWRFFPCFVFEFMDSSIRNKVGFIQYVSPKGGMYPVWEGYRQECVLVFQSLQTVYLAFFLRQNPH